DLLRAFPHHGFTELHQLDTFYNALNPVDQDSLNSAAGDNLLERRTQDVLMIIENKSKIAKLTHAVNQQTSAVTTAMTVILKQFQATLPPAFVKAVEEICITCGGAHPYYQYLPVDGNTFLEIRDNIQDTFQQPRLTTIRDELKSITTRSGIVLNGPSVQMPPPFINPEEDERVEETLTDSKLGEFTIKVPPPLVQKAKPLSQRNYVKMLKDLLSNKEKLLELANTPLNENCSTVILKKLPEKLGDPGKFLIPCSFYELKCKALADLVPLYLVRPFIRIARALIDVHGEEMILRDDYLEDLFATNHLSGNPTFSSHTNLTSPEIKDDIFDLEGDIVLIEKFLNLDSTKDLPPPHNINPLSGSTISSSPNHLLEEFTDELALITFPPGNDDLPFDIESDLREIEYLLNHDLIKEMDSILEDSIDESNLEKPNDNLVDTIPEMFTDEHTLDYSSPLLYDEYDDLFELEYDNEYVYYDPFDSKKEKIKESKLLIDELDPPRSSDFLPSLEYDSFLFEDFFEVDALTSTNNEDKVFNLAILIHGNLAENTIQVTQDKNVKKIAISHASLILKDFDPPLYELPFHKEVLWSETLLSFSSKNEEKFSNPRFSLLKEFILLLSRCQKPGHLAARLGCAEIKVATWDDLAFKLIILRLKKLSWLRFGIQEAVLSCGRVLRFYSLFGGFLEGLKKLSWLRFGIQGVVLGCGLCYQWKLLVAFCLGLTAFCLCVFTLRFGIPFCLKTAFCLCVLKSFAFCLKNAFCLYILKSLRLSQDCILPLHFEPQGCVLPLREPDLFVPVPESFHEQTDEELTENDIKRMDEDDQAIQTILLGLPEDVYATVDSREIAKEIWERVREMMKGSDIKEQEKKAKLFNEWEKFTSTDGESIKSYYHRFMQLMNDLKRNKHFPENVAANLKFLNNLQLEWKRHVTIVRQTKNLHEADFTQICDFLKMNQDEVNELRAELLVKTHDPLYNPQPSLNQNFMQTPMTSLEDINDPTKATNTALILFAKAFQLTAPTNNNQSTSLNPRNCQIAQPEKSSISSFMEEKKRLKHDFKTQEDKYLDKEVDLEAKIKDLENILLKRDQTVQTMHMLNPKPDSFYHPDQKLALDLSDDTIPSVTRKFLNEVKNSLVTLQCVVKQKMTLEVHNWSSSAHKEIQFLQEAAKFVQDFKSLEKGVDESLDKQKSLELKIKRLLKASVSHDIMSIVQNGFVDVPSDLQTELGPYHNMQQKVERLQAQLRDLKGKSSDTPSASNTLDPLNQKLETKIVELEFQVVNYEREISHLKTTYKNLFDSITSNRRSPSGGTLASIEIWMVLTCSKEIVLQISTPSISMTWPQLLPHVAWTGKSKRASHPPKPVLNSKKQLHLLHIDLCGLMRVASINELIKNFLKKIYVRLQAPVIIVRTDNGTEFKNHALKEYFDSVGITHETSAAKTPQQNGVVEFKNRTLVKAARTMLIFSHPPLFLWAEAIATACYNQNRSIIHRRFNMTPYELIQGKTPDISYLHVFWALCYLKNDCEDISKLGAKGDIGFFIGYSANFVAYRVYNRRTKKIIETINVTFDELSAMAFEQNSSKPDLQSLTSGQISFELELTYAPSIITPQRPCELDLDILFEPLHNEYLGDSAQAPTNSSNTSVSSHNVDAPSQQHVQQQGNHTSLPTVSADDVSNAVFEGDLFINPFATPSTESVISSTHYVDPSNMHTFYQSYPYDYQWTKDHPLEQVIGEPSRLVLTRSQLKTDGDMCIYALTVSIMEPKLDIVHATYVCARYQAYPTKKHLKEFKRIFRYLWGTVNTGLWYTKDSSFELTGFSDADYTRCKDTFKSTSNGVQFLGEKLVS
nr:hypothetical protein [Tanacetum cinerariifolium]